MSMSDRAVQLMGWDVEYWKETGSPLDIDELAPQVELTPDPEETEEEPDVSDRCCEFLRKLAIGGKPTNGELVELAHLLEVRPEILKKIRDRYLDGECHADSIAAS